jgi:hypothetical protein
MGELDNYSVEFVMQLYRSRLYAERYNNKMALRILKIKYPDLFSTPFETFISNLSATIHYFKHNKSMNFVDILKVSNDLEHPDN